MPYRQLLTALIAFTTAAAALFAAPQTPAFLPVDEVKPGMVGVGRTIFAGEALDEFKATIIGVLKNINGPNRDLILARLEGGPLATTGVIQGMSGSPVYIDGRLVGAVSYSLGSFPKEPLAGITPIREMTDAVDSAPVRPMGARAGLTIGWPATSAEVFAALAQVAARATSPLGDHARHATLVGPASLSAWAPALRPIGASLVFSGFDDSLDRSLRNALAPAGSAQAPARTSAALPSAPTLRPGDPVGMSLMRGDLEMGATGTVTHVDGNRVYAFGHPFLNLGSTSVAMTTSHVFTVLPSLESSLKIASLGSVIGVINQDRATAIGGTLGPGPKELQVSLTLASDRAPDRRFTFSVLQDRSLTPLFTYVALLNSLTAYERQTGVMAISASGLVSFGKDGQVEFDDSFSGDSAITSASAALVSPIGAAMTNEYQPVTPERLSVTLRASEQESYTTIERAWLDTTQPRFGATHNLQVQLKDYRGGRRTVSMPVTMPMQADGPLTLLVSDGPTLTKLEKQDLQPGRTSNWSEILRDITATRRNNRLYVRLIGGVTGTVVAGDVLPGLPGSVRSVLDTDSTVAKTPLSRAIVGAWDQRFDVAVRGSRELTVTLKPAP